VARRGRTLVIAEVKTRQTKSAGEGFEAVGRAKQEQLVRLADAYLVKHGNPRLQIRYDVLSLFWTGRRFVIDYFPDAFRPVSDPRAPWKWRT
jgi:putative endonuclease